MIKAFQAQMDRLIEDSRRREDRLVEDAKIREERLLEMMEARVSDEATSSRSNGPSFRPISVDRPILSSTATTSDFATWKEGWDNYALCQHLARQSRLVRVAALKTCLDGDLQRFIIQKTIEVDPSSDVDGIITVLSKYIRSQRNPLLDRIEFYKASQDSGETFDNFFTRLREIFSACNFESDIACSTCKSREDDLMRDRIVCGIMNDDTRHRLLAEQDLTLEKAIKICQAEEGASASQKNLGPKDIHGMSTYKRGKNKPKPTFQSKRCDKCARKAHNSLNECPAKDKSCHRCGKLGHFSPCCGAKSHHNVKEGPKSSKHMSAIQVARIQNDECLNLETKIEDGSWTLIPWIPDTGSDVEAMDVKSFQEMGGNVKKLNRNRDTIRNVSGVDMQIIGACPILIRDGQRELSLTLHIFSDISGCYLSRSTLKSLGYLPNDWPKSKMLASIYDDDVNHKRIKMDFIEEFRDVFDEKNLKPMTGQPMKIQLVEGAIPFQVRTARRIPVGDEEHLKTQLENMLKGEIIERCTEPSEWCHPIVIVRKKDSNEPRMTVDMTKLNSQVKRPVHPMRSPRDVIASMAGARFFTKLDCRHGYWQVALDEKSRPLTTFMTQFGRFRYLRVPQGFIAAGDEFNMRTDQAFEDIPRLAKVVDDILIFDDDFDTHVKHVRQVLERAHTHGITFSVKKFEFGKSEVQFCGYIVSQAGWKIDPEKTKALSEFPVPENRTDLRSFFGLVNQFAEFSSDVAGEAEPLRDLLKEKHVFNWESDHNVAFEKVKKALVSTPTLAYFNFHAKTRLETDASRTRGLGFALLQEHDGAWRLVQCGSRFLSGAESRYAMIELELLAAVWAMKKCHVYLSGLKFDLIVDHKPLIPILNNYTLDKVDNPRLVRLLLKIQEYQFVTSWKKGKEHVIADALSRSPVDQPNTDDQHGEDLSAPCTVCTIFRNENTLPDLKMDRLRDELEKDPESRSLKKIIMDGFPDSKLEMPNTLQPFWCVREHLRVVDGLILKGERLVIPKSLRKVVLQDLHASHQGQERTKRRARQVVYWPGLNNEVDTMVQHCEQCRLYQSSQTKEPMMSDTIPEFPFQVTSVDLFEHCGFQYLVYVDRLSGWPCTDRLGRTANSSDVIRFIRKKFPDLGVPCKMISDGGPQFSSRKFRLFCEKWNIKHEMSSPHYPQSNGHAENAVKTVKRLLQKTTRNGDVDCDEFQRAMLEWRNTPRSDGKSPAMVLYGRPLDSFVFAYRNSFAPKWKTIEHQMDVQLIQPDVKKKTVEEHYNKSARSLRPLRIGEYVDIQNFRSKLWDSHGRIVSIGKRRDYYIRTTSGRVYWRNRRFLRPRISPINPILSTTSFSNSTPPDLSEIPDIQLRRSSRMKTKVKRMNISDFSTKSYD